MSRINQNLFVANHGEAAAEKGSSIDFLGVTTLHHGSTVITLSCGVPTQRSRRVDGHLVILLEKTNIVGRENIGQI
jgi:hypothetical protein